MTRLWPRLLGGLTAVSLALCVAAGWLWHRSYRFMPGAVWTKTTHVSDAGRFVERWEFETYCCRGGLLVEFARYRHPFAGLQRIGIDPHRWGEDRRLNPWEGPLAQPYPTIPANYRGEPSHDYLGRGGFQACAVGIGSWFYSGYAAVLPCWFLMACTSALPLLSVRRMIRRRRIAARRRCGLCQHCGYDIRATPDRCPECGAVPAASEV